MLHSRWSKVLGILPLVGALAGLAGCQNQGATDDENTDVAASELGGDANAKGDKPHRARGDHKMGDRGPGMRGERGHGAGPGMLLGAALRELTLSDAQKKTIEAELEALHEDAQDGRDDHEDARKALADAVKSGKIDEAALLAQAPKPPVDTARIAKAITVLHDTLTATQRKELVDAVAAKMEKFGGPEGRPGKGARGDDDARGPGKGGRGNDKGERGDHGARMGGPLGHMLRGIDMTDAQRESIRTALEKLAPSEADREAMKANHEAFRKTMSERLQSFASDSFDASTFVAPPKDGARMGPQAMAGHMVKALAVVVPLLDETQRAELAKRIEAGPMMGPKMGKHRGHSR